MLKQTQYTNIGQTERLLSLLGGGALVTFGLARRSLFGLLLAAGGGALIARGFKGESPLYEQLGLERGQRGVRVREAITVNKPRAEVYQYWRDFENLPSFMRHLKTVYVDGDRQHATHSHWIAKAPLNRMVEWDAELVDDKPNEQIGWRSLPGSEINTRGTVLFRDAPGGRGTEVHVRLEYDPPGGQAAAALAMAFGEEPHLQIEEDLRRFKQVMEVGEAATTQGQSSGRQQQVREQRAVHVERGLSEDQLQEIKQDEIQRQERMESQRGGLSQ